MGWSTMRCEEVIGELAAPTGEPDQTAMAEHLAGCPACARWARRAAWLDALWEATSPPEPSPAAWDSAWATIAQALESPAPVAAGSSVVAGPSRNGRSAKVVAHPAPAQPAARRPAWRLAPVAWIGLAQAAAILIALILVGRTPDPSQIPQNLPIAQKNIPPGVPGPSVVRVALPVRVEVNIEEGWPVVIRAEGQVPQVAVVTGQGMASVLEGWCVVAGGAGGTAILAQEKVPGVDPWYVMFNEAESMATPRIASR
jgi:hypothetical protein